MDPLPLSAGPARRVARADVARLVAELLADISGITVLGPDAPEPRPEDHAGPTCRLLATSLTDRRRVTTPGTHHFAGVVCTIGVQAPAGGGFALETALDAIRAALVERPIVDVDSQLLVRFATMTDTVDADADERHAIRTGAARLEGLASLPPEA